MPSTSPNTQSKEGNVGPLSKKGTFMSKHCLSKYGEAKTDPLNYGRPKSKSKKQEGSTYTTTGPQDAKKGYVAEKTDLQPKGVYTEKEALNYGKHAMNMNDPMTKKGCSYK